MAGADPFGGATAGPAAGVDPEVGAWRAAVAATRVDDPARWQALLGLARALHSHFNRTGDRDDIDAAVAAVGEASRLVPARDPSRPLVLALHCMFLTSRFEHLGGVTDLDGAVDAGRLAVAGPLPDATRSQCLLILGHALRLRFERAGDAADLDEAIAVGRSMIAAADPADGDALATGQWTLGTALLTRATRTGDATDLDAAIALLRAAAAATADGTGLRTERLSNLGVALWTRFTVLGESADLDAALTAYRTAADASRPGEPGRALHLSNLGAALGTRYERLRRLADVHEAVEVGRAAVAETPAAHPARATRLNNLAAALGVRYDRLGAVQDLQEAVGVRRAAVAAVAADDPDRATHLAGLAHALATRYECAGRSADLDEAMAYGRAAVAATVPGDPEAARRLGILGQIHAARFALNGPGADADEALRVWRRASTEPTAAADVRISAGRDIGRFAASLGRWAEAADGLAAAVGLLPLLAWHGVGRRDRERVLSDWSGLAAHAAAGAIAAGRPDRAIEVLEQGRGVLWSQLLETRTSLTSLRAAAPGLAAALDAVRGELDGPGGEPDRRMALAREWDRLVAEVRARPGYDDFGRTPPLARLRRAAAGGTVVVVNASEWRCDAILVTADAVRVVPLPDADLATLGAHAAAYPRTPAAGATPRDLTAAETRQELGGTLGWLWDAVAAPVLAALGHDRPPGDGERRPRLWWYPTGPFALLPLHAAGHHDRGTGDSVLDRVVSSYTPTLRALAESRSRPASTAPDRLLFIGLPETPGQSPLPAVERERALLTELLDGERCTVLAGRDATRAAILRALAGHRWAHASCHGMQDLDDPASGGLLPHDWQHGGRLSVADLAGGDRPAGELMFLAACRTATAGHVNADEIIHLAAALSYTGWRHVVATLWSVPDTAAADITYAVYPRLVRAGRLDSAETARALHHAVRQCRDQAPDQPDRWAPFIHIGP